MAKKLKTIAVAILSEETGASRPAIYKALKSGKLTKADAGFILMDELYKNFVARKKNGVNIDPSLAKNKKPTKKVEETEENKEELGGFDAVKVAQLYAFSQAKEKNHKAGISELEYLRRRGELVDKQEMIFAIEEALLVFTKKIAFELPNTLNARLSMYFSKSPLVDECMNKIRSDIEEALSSLNDDLKTMKIHDKGDEVDE